MHLVICTPFHSDMNCVVSNRCLYGQPLGHVHLSTYHKCSKTFCFGSGSKRFDLFLENHYGATCTAAALSPCTSAGPAAGPHRV